MAGPFHLRDDAYDWTACGAAGVPFFSLRSAAFLTRAFFADVVFFGVATFSIDAFFAAFFTGTAFLALIAAHLFRWASAIRFLASTLSFAFEGFLAEAVASFAGVTIGALSAFFVIQRLRCRLGDSRPSCLTAFPSLRWV
jgi:hypothetical protein